MVSQLLGDLGTKLQGLGTTTLATAVTGIQTTITGLEAQLGVSATDLPPVTVPTIPPLPVDTTPLTSLLPGLGIPQLPSSPTPADITNVINQLNATLASLLTQALQTLATTPVLSVSGVQVGLASKAADTLADSAASITANLGTVKVGTLASVDLTSLLNQATSAVQGLVAQLNTAVSTLLGTVNAQLAHLVTVSVLDQTKSVSESGGYTNAVAGITALTAKITPPANVAGLFRAQATTPSVGDLITQAGGAVPALAGAMSTLNATLSVPALAAGGVVKLGTLSVSSRHTPAAAPAPGTTGGGTPAKGAPGSPLPATGTDQAPLAVLGIAFAAIALALLRWLHRPSPTN